jgi:hypothetical protein
LRPDYPVSAAAMRKSQERSGRVTVFPSAYEAGSLGVPAASNVTERSRYFARNTSGPFAQSFRWKVSFEAVLGSISPSTVISLALNAHRSEMSKSVKPVRPFDCADTWLPFRCANGIETITDCNWRSCRGCIVLRNRQVTGFADDAIGHWLLATTLERALNHTFGAVDIRRSET